MRRPGTPALALWRESAEASTQSGGGHELHDEDSVPRGSRGVHDPIRCEEVRQDRRRDDYVRRRMQLRADGRPSFQTERVLKTQEAVVVPQLEGQGRIHGEPEPHGADVGESLVRRDVPGTERREQGEARNSCGVVTLFTPNTAGV